MAFRVIVPGVLSRFTALGFILVVAGCQGGDNAGGVLSLGRQPVDVEAEQAKVDAADLRAYCPSVQLRSNAAVLNRYEAKAEGDAAKLIYQASISETTRACGYGGGSLTINVAVAGKVIPGPLGGGGAVTVPIKIEVVQGDVVLYSRVQDFSVQTQPSAGATQFVYSDPSIVIPQPAVRDVQVFAGFDVPTVKPEPL